MPAGAEILQSPAGNRNQSLSNARHAPFHMVPTSKSATTDPAGYYELAGIFDN